MVDRHIIEVIRKPGKPTRVNYVAKWPLGEGRHARVRFPVRRHGRIGALSLAKEARAEGLRAFAAQTLFSVVEDAARDDARAARLARAGGG